jgi:hypothetical protein
MWASDEDGDPSAAIYHGQQYQPEVENRCESFAVQQHSTLPLNFHDERHETFARGETPVSFPPGPFADVKDDV